MKISYLFEKDYSEMKLFVYFCNTLKTKTM